MDIPALVTGKILKAAAAHLHVYMLARENCEYGACIRPRPDVAHTQAGCGSYPGRVGFIPRPGVAHTQAGCGSYPGRVGFIPRPGVAHTQARCGSYPGRVWLVLMLTRIMLGIILVLTTIHAHIHSTK